MSRLSSIRAVRVIFVALLVVLGITVPASAQARVTNGLLVLYTFEEQNGNTVRDLSGVAPAADLLIGNTGAVTWNVDGSLNVNSPTLIASTSHVLKIYNSVTASDEVTVEAWIRPSLASQGAVGSGDRLSRIVAFSDNQFDNHMNFSLDQLGTRWHSRFRTDWTGTDAIPGGPSSVNPTPPYPPTSFFTSNTNIIAGNTYHLVMVRNFATQTMTYYINGVQHAQTTWQGTADFPFVWRLTLANSTWEPYLGGVCQNCWLGTYYLVAVYGRALSLAEVQQNYAAGHNIGAPPMGSAPTDGDGDGFADTIDQCPTVPGTINGCPDTDGDGFADSLDECDTVPGTLNGCPDADGDGYYDAPAVDLCPAQFGTNNGCPVDTDGDGFDDHLDDCPTLPGTAPYNGCPAPAPGDQDGDGFPDSVDQCLTVPGVDNGCPADTDGDGFDDINDNCPTVPGPNNGCPLPPAANNGGGQQSARSTGSSAPTPLCDGTNGVVQRVRAQVPGSTVTNGSVFCNELDGDVNSQVGDAFVISQGIQMAVDVFGLDYAGNSVRTFNSPVRICLPGQGGIYFLDANAMPRTPQAIPTSFENGFTCGSIPNAGTVVLVNASTGSAPAGAAAASAPGEVVDLSGRGCTVVTTNIVNLREQPTTSSVVLTQVAYQTQLEVTGSAPGWWRVVTGSQQGFISADYATASGSCQ